MVNTESLGIYLNDHLAGSVVVLDLLQRLIDEADDDKPRHDKLVQLRESIEADRTVLESLMSQITVSQSVSRQATAWVAGKLSDLKLRVDDDGDGAMRLFESLEAAAIGIAGKQKLWFALELVQATSPVFTGLDLNELKSRGEWQADLVEPLRLAAARAAFLSAN